MTFNLALLWRRSANPRRREVTLRKIVVPSTFASDLYATAYRPVITTWEQAIPAIMAEYERTLSELTQDSAADASERIAAVETALAQLIITIRIRLAEWGARVERYHRGKWRGAILTATGVDIGTLVGAGDMRMPIGNAVERNVALIRSISDGARGRISDSVFRGFQRRAPPREVAKEIQEAVGGSRKRALRVAADQNVKLASALNEERRREAGIDTFEWVHSGKLHYRPEHKARDGKKYTDDRPPPTMPGEEPYCGCTSRAVIIWDDE